MNHTRDTNGNVRARLLDFVEERSGPKPKPGSAMVNEGCRRIQQDTLATAGKDDPL